MKNPLLLIVGLAILGALIWIGVEQYRFHSESPVLVSQPPHPAPPAPPPLLALDEWQQYRQARDSALQANPSLQEEQQDILQKMVVQQKKLDDAMVKADPKVAPIMVKLQALRAQHEPGAPSAAQGSTAATVSKLTPEDMQELGAARNAAFHSDPKLIEQSSALAVDMQDHQKHLDAAMLKAHPELVTIIAKFEGGRRSPVVVTTAPIIK